MTPDQRPALSYGDGNMSSVDESTARDNGSPPGSEVSGKSTYSRADVDLWRADALEKAAQIVERYFPEEATYCAGDIRGLKAPSPPVAKGEAVAAMPMTDRLEAKNPLPNPPPIPGGGEPTRDALAYELAKRIGRLSHSQDEGYYYPDDPDDALATMDGLIAEARELMALPAHPGGGGAELREAIAREVDPEAWRDHDRWMEAAIRYDDQNEDTLAKIERVHAANIVKPSLTKADAILSLIPAQTAGDWQDIKAAPRDGSPILGLRDASRVVVEWIAPRSSRTPGYWATVPGRWQVTPTHWMPLPAAPLQGEG